MDQALNIIGYSSVLLGMIGAVVLIKAKRSLPFVLAFTMLAFPAGALCNASAAFVVSVDGTFVSTRGHGKGSGHDIVVRDSAGDEHALAIDTGGADCTVGSRVVKPAFSFNYTCNGRPVSQTPIENWVGIIVCLALTLAVLGLLGRARVRVRGAGPYSKQIPRF
ncbi:MAG: hypothetical protein IPK60_02135 [Sandaracinaceae bacterium]|nr:hypothetical protein [Sandaracinaceae bacterium]